MDDYHLNHLGRFARGGAGLIVMEATAVCAAGRITPSCAGIWKDEHIAPMKTINDYLHCHGAMSGLQLAHAGRKASTAAVQTADGLAHEADGGWPKDVIGPSTIPWDQYHWPPRAMTKDDIKAVIGHFAAAAARADKAGFDMVELHGAHGYLISSFGSPLANNRTDEYGGSLENRMRFAVEVAQAVRAVFPAHKPIAMRLSCSDWVEGGWTINDTIALARQLFSRVGVDIIDCSSGAQSPLQRIVFPVAGAGVDLYQVPFAAAVKAGGGGVLSAAVGMIETPQQADHIITSGKADLVMIGRQFLREPTFALRCAATLTGVTIPRHQQQAAQPVHLTSSTATHAASAPISVATTTPACSSSTSSSTTSSSSAPPSKSCQIQ